MTTHCSECKSRYLQYSFASYKTAVLSMHSCYICITQVAGSLVSSLMTYHDNAGNYIVSSLRGTSAAVCCSVRCRDRLANVHEHPFADVREAARQKQPIGDIRPDAADNALAVMSQVTLWDA